MFNANSLLPNSWDFPSTFPVRARIETHKHNTEMKIHNRCVRFYVMPSAFNHFIFQVPHVCYTAINSYTCGYTITACVKNGTGTQLEHSVWQHSGKSIHTIFQLVCVLGILLLRSGIIIFYLLLNLPFLVRKFSIAVHLNIIFHELKKLQFERNSN